MPGLRRALLERVPALAGFMVLAVIFLVGGQHGGTAGAGGERLKAPVTASGPWEDAGTITYNIDCKEKGLNPYRVPCAPGDRNYNYPPVWLQLSHLGVHVKSTPVLGWLFTAFTVVVYLLMLRSRTAFSAVCVFIAIALSSPLILATERGNNDQVVLFLLCFAFLLASRLPESRGNLLRGAAVMLLTALKIYPVAATISLWRGRRGLWMVFGWGVASVALLVVTAGSSLADVFHETPTLLYATFGIMPVLYWAGLLAHHDLSSWVVLHRTADFGLAAALFLGFTALGAAFAGQAERFLPAIRIGRFRDSLAIACAGIYCFAFSGGASFDYRLIFLIPVLAFLLQAFDAGKRSAAWLCMVIVAYLVVPSVHGRPRAAMDLLLFLAFSIWLGAFAHRQLRIAPALGPQAEPA